MKRVTIGVLGLLAAAATGCTSAQQQKESLYQTEIDRLSAERSILKRNFEEERLRRERAEALALRTPSIMESAVPIKEVTAVPGDKATAKASAKKPVPTKSSLTDREVQAALKNAGYYHGKVDGKVGPQTKAAIKQFQKAHGLKPDGVVGRQTRGKLGEFLR